MSTIALINMLNDQIFEELLPDEIQKVDEQIQTSEIKMGQCYKRLDNDKQYEDMIREGNKQRGKENEIQIKLLFQVKKLRMNVCVLKLQNQALKQSMNLPRDRYYEEVINGMQTKIQDIMEKGGGRIGG